MTKKILLTIAGLVLIAMLYMQFGKTEHNSVHTTLEETAAGTVSADVPSVESVEPKAPQPEPISDLRTAFERSDDLYALMDAHARSNSAESLWLISKIADYCAEFGRNPTGYVSDSQLEHVVSSADPKSYQAARLKVSHRCRGFVAGEAKDDITHAALLVHKTRAARAGSLAAEAALLSQRAPLSADTEYLKNVVRRVLDSMDPDAYAALSMAMVDGRLSPLIQEEMSGLIDGQNGIYAWYLAACRLGLDCTRNGALMTRLCTETFFCRQESFERMVFNQELSLVESEKIRRMVLILTRK